VVDLKKRLGHAFSAAALRYIHAVEGRRLEIDAVPVSPRLGRQRGQVAEVPLKPRYRTSYRTDGVGTPLTCMYVYV
jgi:hypothetical protein